MDEQQVAKIERMAANLDDAELYEVHRRVSRLATARRIQRDPEYQRRLAVGRHAALSKSGKP